MSTEENKAVVRRWWETWWETAITMNLHVFDALIDEAIADKWSSTITWLDLSKCEATRAQRK